MIFAHGIADDHFLDISDIRRNIIEIEQKYEESNK